MNISARCEYACRAMTELARREHDDHPLTALEIAERRSIPEKYLVHILLQLKRSGLVRSVRGAQGGYHLTRSPDEINLLQIVQAIDGPVMEPTPVADAGAAGLQTIWKEVAGGIAGVLGAVTLRAIVDRAARSPMYYI